jgi:hypothetical protein
MVMLGDFLATARRSANGVERWLLADHPELHARVSEAAAREGTSSAWPSPTTRNGRTRRIGPR